MINQTAKTITRIKTEISVTLCDTVNKRLIKDFMMTITLKIVYAKKIKKKKKQLKSYFLIIVKIDNDV